MEPDIADVYVYVLRHLHICEDAVDVGAMRLSRSVASNESFHIARDVTAMHYACCMLNNQLLEKPWPRERVG